MRTARVASAISATATLSRNPRTYGILRITEYADKLLEGLKHVDYPANVKAQQENWIGKSTGAFVDFYG